MHNFRQRYATRRRDRRLRECKFNASRKEIWYAYGGSWFKAKPPGCDVVGQLQLRIAAQKAAQGGSRNTPGPVQSDAATPVLLSNGPAVSGRLIARTMKQSDNLMRDGTSRSVRNHFGPTYKENGPVGAAIRDVIESIVDLDLAWDMHETSQVLRLTEQVHPDIALFLHSLMNAQLPTTIREAAGKCSRTKVLIGGNGHD